MAFIPCYYVSTFPQCWKLAPNQIRRMDSISTSQNNYDLSIESTTNGRNGEVCTIFELVASTAVNITGIVAPTAGTGTIILLYNAGSSTITLKNASASSAAANRMNVTAGADYSLTAGAWAVLHYDAAGAWTVGTEVPQNSFKLAAPGSTEGVILFFDNNWWKVKHLSKDATGTGATTDVFYRYGSTVPTADYTSTTAATRASIVLASGAEDIIQVKRNIPNVYFLTNSATAVVLRFAKFDQGSGYNRQG